MLKIELRSYLDQAIYYLKHPSFTVDDVPSLLEEIAETFTCKDLLELDAAVGPSVNLENLWSLLNRTYWFNEFFNREIQRYEDCLSEGQFVLLLLKKKAFSSNITVNSTFAQKIKTYYIDLINKNIIQLISVLKQDYRAVDFYSEKDIFYLFLIFPKEEALKKFEHYIHQRKMTQNFDEFAQNLYTFLERTFDILGLKHIPFIDRTNYRHDDLHLNTNNEFVTINELRQILGDYNYFQTEPPLLRLDNKYRLHLINDVKQNDLFYFIFERYFEEELGLTTDKFGNRIFKVFLNNISTDPTEFKTHEYCDVQKLLSEKFKEKDVLKSFLALLDEMNKGEIIKNATAKFPKILYKYVNGIKQNSNSIKQDFTREDNIHLSIRDNVRNFIKKNNLIMNSLKKQV